MVPKLVCGDKSLCLWFLKKTTKNLTVRVEREWRKFLIKGFLEITRSINIFLQKRTHSHMETFCKTHIFSLFYIFFALFSNLLFGFQIYFFVSSFYKIWRSAREEFKNPCGDNLWIEGALRNQLDCFFMRMWIFCDRWVWILRGKCEGFSCCFYKLRVKFNRLKQN